MPNLKSTILDLVIEEVEDQIKHAERGKSDAIEESRAHKGAMESRYDTFKEEAQYLAGGFSSQLIELGKLLGALKSVKERPPASVTKGSGYALIEAENLGDGSKTKYLLLPAGGGNSYEVDGEKITVLNVGAPMARAFMGSTAGDEVELKIQGKTKHFNIVSIT
jgi:transcription elongation GreA/GreB family factor